jgi:hypothetical protein
MEPMGAVAEAPIAKQPNAGTAEAPAATTTPTTSSSPVAPAKEIAPSKSEQTIAQYLHSGNGTSTLLSSNFPGIIADRAAMLSPRASPATPTKSEVAFRLRHNPKQLTAFRTQGDKDAFNGSEKLSELRDRRSQLKRELAEQKEKTGGEKSPLDGELSKKISTISNTIRRLSKFRPLSRSTGQDIINRMVLGKYDKQGLLKGRTVHKKYPLMNSIHGELLKNPTYLTKDARQFMGKLVSLLPSAAIQLPAAKKPVVKKAKA